VERGWLHGTEIHLTLSDGRKLHGRVDGDRMDATPAGGVTGTIAGWHAIRTSR